jgi:hypothetical protein
MIATSRRGIPVLVALLLTVWTVAAAVPADADQPRSSVCHITGITDLGFGPTEYGHVIAIAGPAIDAHLAHGDRVDYEERDVDGSTVCVPDSDGDGVGDDADAFPDDPTETADPDGDGVGDNAAQCPGADDTIHLDEDGIPDSIDPYVGDPGTLTVTKVVDWSGTSPDESQVFEVCISGPTYPAEPSCVELGDSQSATWLELNPGDYTVTETDPGLDWEVTGSGHVATVVSGSNTTHTITNTYQAPG